MALQDGLKKILIFSNDENPTRSNKALTDLAKQKAADLQARLARPRPIHSTRTQRRRAIWVWHVRLSARASTACA